MNTSDYRGGSHIKYPNLLNPAIIKERINPHYYTPRGTVESTKGVDTDFPKYRDMWERAKAETKK
jgi:hypothetical protein